MKEEEGVRKMEAIMCGLSNQENLQIEETEL